VSGKERKIARVGATAILPFRSGKIILRNSADSPLLHLFTGEIPNKLLLRIEKSELPPDWRSHPPPASTREIGTTWFRTRQSVGLLVPSTIIPEEVNCLLNPFHPDFLIDWFSGPEAYSIDPRVVSMPPL
jgi:hypothetical protein